MDSDEQRILRVTVIEREMLPGLAPVETMFPFKGRSLGCVNVIVKARGHDTSPHPWRNDQCVPGQSANGGV